METGGYVGYLGVVLWFGVVGGGDGNGGGGWWRLRWGSVGGGWGGVACLCGFGLSVMTVSKTVLYCKSFLSRALSEMLLNGGIGLGFLVLDESG